jgi:hypothetical protein
MPVQTVFTATSTCPGSNMTSMPPKPTYITASIALFHSLSQHFALGHPTAEGNELVRSAMQSAYNICHSDEAYDHPEKTRGRLLTMFSEYNQKILDEWKKHPDNFSFLQGSATTTNIKLFALTLAPEKVDTQPRIENNMPDDLWDVDGRRYRVDFPFGIKKETLELLTESVWGLRTRLVQMGIRLSGKGLKEDHWYRERDDCDPDLTEAEQTGLQVLANRNQLIISD